MSGGNMRNWMRDRLTNREKKVKNNNVSVEHNKKQSPTGFSVGTNNVLNIQ